MKKILFASVCIVALSTAGAFAQSQPAPGASSEGNVGPGATRNTPGAVHNTKKGMTTGSSATTTRRHSGAMAHPSGDNKMEKQSR